MRPPLDSGGSAVRQQPDAGARTQAGSGASDSGDEIAAATKAKGCSKPGNKWVLRDGVREVVADVPAR